MADKVTIKPLLIKAMNLSSRREYCLSEMESKLREWGAGHDEITEVRARLTEEKFIDEKRYASAFVRDKFTYNKWGKVKISTLLRVKRIPDEIISEALELIDQEKYQEVLKSLLAKHKTGIRAANSYELKAKLFRFGVSRGFESSLINEILGESLDD